MTQKELKQYQNELVELRKNSLSGKQIDSLLELASKVGAPVTELVPDSRYTITDVVNGIQQALQTASMINMAETAARSYWIALVASLIALLSAAAAWVAVFVQIVGNMKQLYL
jgi:hypothetical protein